jgi:hypothetical protein
MEVNKGTGSMVLKADFFDHYHYKNELAALCREYHLAASGTKARTSGPTAKINLGAITLTTPLAGSGFTFNAAARLFLRRILRHLRLRSPSQWQLSNGKSSHGLS